MKSTERVAAAYAACKVADAELAAALDALIAQHATKQIGEDMLAAGNAGHMFRIEKITARVHADGRCVDISYTGHRLKQDGTPHATTGGHAWQFVDL